MSILCPQNGVHFGGRIAGPRIRTPDPGLDRFRWIWTPNRTRFGAPTDWDPEMTPNWTQFGVYFGVSSSTGIIKGPILYIWVYTGLAQIRVRVKVSWAPKCTILGPRDGIQIQHTRYGTSDPGSQIQHIRFGTSAGTSNPTHRITRQIARMIQHVSPSVYLPLYARAYRDPHQHPDALKTASNRDPI